MPLPSSNLAQNAAQTAPQVHSDNYLGKIFLEKIPVRLSNVKDIPFPDILHVYDSSLKGYSVLRDRTGNFHIDEDMIGINEHGAVKVWLNTAFEKNLPNFQKNDNVAESTMVNELLTII